MCEQKSTSVLGHKFGHMKLAVKFKIRNGIFQIQDIQSYVGKSGPFPYPIIADPQRTLAKALGMIDPDELDTTGMPLTCRAVSNGRLFHVYIWTFI